MSPPEFAVLPALDVAMLGLTANIGKFSFVDFPAFSCHSFQFLMGSIFRRFLTMIYYRHAWPLDESGE